jgi:tetratricopeptide (TPR) repeat protein
MNKCRRGSRSAGISFLILFVFGCAPALFPIVKPAQKIEYDQIAKAKAEDYFIKARDLERKGHVREAESWYERAYQLDPSSRELRHLMAQKYIEAGKFLQAIVLVKGNKTVAQLDAEEKKIVTGIYLKMGEFAKAAETLESIDPKSDADNYSLAVVYEAMGDAPKALRYYRMFYQKSDASLDAGLKILRMELALKEFQAADSFLVFLETRHGENSNLAAMRGVIAQSRGDTAAALGLFNKAVVLDSSNEDGLRSAAQIYLQKNEYDKAIANYEKLSRNSQLYKDVYSRTLAILYYYNKQFTQAERLIQTLLGNSYNDDELHFYLGLVYGALQKNDLERIELEKSISLRKDFEDAWRELCYMSIREKNFDGALAAAERYTAVFPKSASAWRLKGTVQSQKKEYRAAQTSYSTAVALDSSNITAWFELGSCYERGKNIAGAAAAFKKVLKLRPSDPAASNYLGYMWAEKGMKLDSARILLESALKAEPDNGAFLDSYAWIFYQMGEFEKAGMYMQKAVARIHNDPVVFEHLGDILYKSNDIRGAVIAYKRCLELSGNGDGDSVRRKIISIEPLLRYSKEPK